MKKNIHGEAFTTSVVAGYAVREARHSFETPVPPDMKIIAGIPIVGSPGERIAASWAYPNSLSGRQQKHQPNAQGDGVCR
jgi:hypothetical protein